MGIGTPANLYGGGIFGNILNGPVGITGPIGPTGMTINSGIFTEYTQPLNSIRTYLLQISQDKSKEAYEYRNSILLKTPVKQAPPFIVPKGSQLHPIIIGYVPDPSSFEWYLDMPKECTEDWSHETAIYEVPSKHKFLDSNILPGSGYIVPMELVLRPLDLNDDRFFFSWYGGFVVPK